MHITLHFQEQLSPQWLRPGAIANPGGQIARIAKTDDYEIKVPIALSKLKAYQATGEVFFTTVEGEEIGSGRISRISEVINQQTQSVDVYYNISTLKDSKVYGGQYLNVGIDQESISSSMTVPRMCVTNGMVTILKDSTVHFQKISIVGSKPDSLYISGVKNGAKIVLDKS